MPYPINLPTGSVIYNPGGPVLGGSGEPTVAEPSWTISLTFNVPFGDFDPRSVVTWSVSPSGS